MIGAPSTISAIRRRVPPVVPSGGEVAGKNFASAISTDGDHGSLVLRSMLFVPGDSDKKLAKCTTVAADALILDLEDAVDPARKPAARKLVAEFLERRGAPQPIWVRINSLDRRAGTPGRDSVAEGAVGR